MIGQTTADDPLASPYSTGGGGPEFEKRYGALILSHLLTGDPVPELGDDATVTSVLFQARAESVVDDLLIVGRGGDGADRRASVAVRHKPKLIPSDDRSVDLLASYLSVLAEHWDEVHARRWRLALAAAPTAPVEQLATLAAIAKGLPDNRRFRDAVARRGRTTRGVRQRLERLDSVVAAASERPEIGEIDHTELTWRFLSSLTVRQLRVEPPDGSDRTATVGRLRSSTVRGTATEADRLLAAITDLVGRYVPAAAEVTEAMLRRDLVGSADLHRSSRHPVAWERLEVLRTRLRQRTSSHLEDRSGNTLVLDRESARADLVKALRRVGSQNGNSSSTLVISGEPDVGKSALTLRAVDAAEGAGAAIVAVSLRDLPLPTAETETYLGAPIEEVLAGLGVRPVRLLVVDGAEAALEGREDLLLDLVTAALRAGLGVAAVTRTDGEHVVRETLRRSARAVPAVNSEPAQHNVDGLTAAEISEAVGTFPALTSLNHERRGTWLLARPGLLSLLLRSHAPLTIPDRSFSEAAVFAAVWSGLVRHHESAAGDGTNPDEREGALLALARRALEPDASAGGSPTRALRSLRSDGLLMAAGPTAAWSPGYEFGSDLIRDFAVARLMVVEGYGRLFAAGAPRWSLRAARLSCQVALARVGEDSEQACREQQAAFDRIATEHGNRWADLPVEAALGLPDVGELLAESWDRLAADGGSGLRRILRLVKQRHTCGGVADIQVASPLARLLLEREWPSALQPAAEEFLAAWLRGLIAGDALTGDRTRIALRTRIERKVAAAEQQARKLAEANASGPTARTSDSDAEDEPQPRTRERDDPPEELCHESTLRFLALLGRDLGASGETLLRRVAKSDPASLLAAVESRQAGTALGQYAPGLLIDLVEAYYIDDAHLTSYDADDVYLGADGMAYTMYDALFTAGIRPHDVPGLDAPLPAYQRGPFLAMLCSDFAGGVACLNRLLNHAAPALMLYYYGDNECDDTAAGRTDRRSVELCITGEPRRYAGDAHIWTWYRGIGHTRNPCMSALQALELVCDKILEREVMLPGKLIRTLLSDCENLAMPACAYGLMVRHIERFDSVIDAFLAEPHIWNLEDRRLKYEAAGFARGSARVVAAERRMWTPLETVAHVVASADDDRARELARTGIEYFKRATADIEGSSRTTELVASARQRARAFDRSEYEVTRSGDDLVLQQRYDPETEADLAESESERRRSEEGSRLLDRYTNRYDQFSSPDPLNSEELESDIATARALVADPPSTALLERGAAPAAVAAAVLEGCFLDGIPIDEDHMVWAAHTLATVVEGKLADHPLGVSLNWPNRTGADRSAARGLPLLLRPDAQPVLDRLTTEGLGKHTVHKAALWLFTGAPNEARYAASQALDSVWQYPCSSRAECFHLQAFDLIEQSVRHSTALVRWHDGPHEPRPLVGPILEALESATAESLIISCLNPALRALGAEAGTPTCVHGPAAELLNATLEAHRRARHAIVIGGDEARWDALFAARAVLARAAAGDPSALRAHVTGFATHFYGLHEFVVALAAAAEESTPAANAARKAWPWVMRECLCILGNRDCRGLLRSTQQDPDIVLLALLPRPTTTSDRYVYREIPHGSISWIDPDSWAREIDQWTSTVADIASSADAATSLPSGAARLTSLATTLSSSIDALIGMLSAIATDQQPRTGIRWIEQIVVAAGEPATRAFSLPGWLQDVRPYCANAELATWHRIVDLLTMHGSIRTSELED